MRQPKILAATLGVAAASLSCGSVVRSGSSPMFLVVNLLQGVAGTPTGSGSPGNPLVSNVLTPASASPPCPVVTPAPPTISCFFVVSDLGQVSLSLVPKNIGITTPSTNNAVTITQYHVAYTRADCDPNCKPGQDVPYPFDGAVTGTIPISGTLTLGFELVKVVAKQEPPLAALTSSPTVLITIATVTFYGHDLVGNAISTTGKIQIDFGRFGS